MSDKLWISKEKFNNVTRIKEKIEHRKWVDFIDRNSYYTWEEDTEQGKLNLSKIDTIPINIRKKYLQGYNKINAEAEFNKNKGYFQLIIGFNKEIGVISITIQKKITKEILENLLEMANYLDALFLKNGTEIIDEKVIEKIEQ